MPLFSFLDNNLSKYQWIFASLGICNDIMEVWYGIADREILSSFGVNCLRHAHILVLNNNLSKCCWIFTKLLGYYACVAFISYNHPCHTYMTIRLTFTTFWTNSAENILKYFFKKTGFYISCKLSLVRQYA